MNIIFEINELILDTSENTLQEASTTKRLGYVHTFKEAKSICSQGDVFKKKDYPWPLECCLSEDQTKVNRFFPVMIQPFTKEMIMTVLKQQ